jgi:hypothetical protein
MRPKIELTSDERQARARNVVELRVNVQDVCVEHRDAVIAVLVNRFGQPDKSAYPSKTGPMQPRETLLSWAERANFCLVPQSDYYVLEETVGSTTVRLHRVFQHKGQWMFGGLDSREIQIVDGGIVERNDGEE